jgi:TRAP-type uncharacterized transport system substrate-binding protein
MLRLRTFPVSVFLVQLCCMMAALLSAPLGAAAQTVLAQARTEARSPGVGEAEPEEVEKANKWTVGLVGGTVDGPNMRFATEIQTALDDGDNLRVLATVSRGTKQNVLDLLYLKGVDIGFVNTAVFEDFKKEGKIKNIENRVQYISQIQVSAYQLLVRPEIKTIADLQGKKVVTPKGAWASPLTADALRKNGVVAELIPDSVNVGLEKLKTGEVAGVAYAFAKGSPNIYSPMAAKGSFHVLPIDYGKFQDSYYVPISLEHNDYPDLITEGDRIETVGAVVVLAVYNWPKGSDRFRKVERFIRYYFDRFDTLKKPPFHPQWKEINLGATVPGWKRYWFADELLGKYLAKSAATSPTSAEQGSAAEAVSAVIKSKGSPEQKKLFEEFMQWRGEKR